MKVHVDINGDVLELGDMVVYNGGQPFKINEFKMRSYGYVVYDGDFAYETKFVEKVKEEPPADNNKSESLPEGWNF